MRVWMPLLGVLSFGCSGEEVDGDGITADGSAWGSTPSLMAPSTITAVAESESRIRVTWDDPNTNERRYAIERSRDLTSGFVEIAQIARNLTTHLDTDLSPSTRYYYRVRALGRTRSDYSPVASAQTEGALCGSAREGVVCDGDLTHVWSRSFGGANVDLGYSVAVDALENVVAAGVFRDTIDFGGDVLTSADGDEGYIVKSSAAGEHVWSRTLGGGRASSVDIDASGDIVVCGSFSGVIDFGGDSHASAGSNDSFVAKYSGVDGTRLWSVVWGASHDDYASAISVDGNGDAVVVGELDAYEPVRTIVVRKLSGINGALVWTKQVDVTLTNDQSIAVDSRNAVLVTGSFAGTVDFGGGPLSSIHHQNVFLAKFTAAGEHVWSGRFGSYLEDARDVAVDANDDVFMTGYFYDATNLGGETMVSSGLADNFVAKYRGGDGGHLWSRRFGSPGDEDSFTVTIDCHGSPVVAGYFTETADYGGTPLVNAGYDDAFVAKYSGATGAHLWSHRFGGSELEEIVDARTDACGYLLLIGNFRSPTAEFGGPTLVNAGSFDVVLAKFTM